MGCLKFTYPNEYGAFNEAPIFHLPYLGEQSTAPKKCEKWNHLGNVLTVISDKPLPHVTTGTTVDYFLADILQASDYSPFGCQLSGRNFTASGVSKDFRYGFNDMEEDDEIKGDGNSYDYGARFYDSRLGRFLSIDNYTKKFPFQSPYVFAGNSVIQAKDNQGDSIYYVYVTMVNNVPVQTIVRAEKVEDLFYMTGMELLYSTEMGKAEIDTYLNSSDYDVYIGKSYESIPGAGGVTSPSRTKKGLADGFCSDDLNGAAYRKPMQIFDGIKGRDGAKLSFFIVIPETPVTSLIEEREGEMPVEITGSWTFDELEGEHKDAYEAVHAKRIFHEMRAHVTYAVQGVPLDKQHDKYGVADGTGTDYNMNKPDADISKITDQVKEALEKRKK